MSKIFLLRAPGFITDLVCDVMVAIRAYRNIRRSIVVINTGFKTEMHRMIALPTYIMTVVSKRFGRFQFRDIDMKRIRIPVVVYSKVKLKREIIRKVAVDELRKKNGLFVYLKPF